MRFLPVSCHSLSLAAAAALVLAIGCQPAMIVDTVITANSCTDNAHTMSFIMHSNCPINSAIFEGGTPNVLGIRDIYANGTDYNMTVVSELDNAMKNDPVQEHFRSGVTIVQSPVVASLADLSFYQADWQSIGAPDCGPVHSPQYTVTYTAPPGRLVPAASPASLDLAVSDPYPLPMMLVTLDLVESPTVLDPSQLDWDNATFNALPWVSAAPGGAALDPASAPLAVNLPDTATGTAVLCRYISIYDGMEVRGIIQIDLEPPLATKLSTWGAVKALYRG